MDAARNYGRRTDIDRALATIRWVPRRPIREVSDEAYLLACQIIGVEPLESDDKDNPYYKWERLGTVTQAKRSLEWHLERTTPLEKYQEFKEIQSTYANKS